MTFNIETDTNIKIICSSDPNKAHVCDEILMHMLKMCVTSISKSLHIPFNNSLMNKCFVNEWKKVIITPSSENRWQADKKLPTYVTPTD